MVGNAGVRGCGRRSHLVKVAVLLVAADELLELVRVDDDVQRANLRQPKLLVLDARGVHLLPRAGRVGLARGVDGRLVLVEVHQAGGEARKVGDGGEEDLCRLVEALGVAALRHVLDAADVGRRDEVLELGVHARLRAKPHESELARVSSRGTAP
eukprot:6181855-Pleurochrysis_carterae.AAC.1